MKKIINLVALLMLSLATFGNHLKTIDFTENFVLGTPKIKSMSQLTFGPQGILFVGDSKSSQLFAIATNDVEKPNGDVKISVRDLEG